MRWITLLLIMVVIASFGFLAQLTTPKPGGRTLAQVSPVPGAGRWLDRPPASPGATETCPAPGQWLLLYWGGDTAIALAAVACPNADLFWASREGRWFGYAIAAPAASDTWEVLRGEAHFVHGR